MAKRTRARLGSDDSLVCHRAGYASLSPQACLEKHVAREDACGNCRHHMVAAAVMSDALDADPERVYQITKEGGISKVGNPLIRPESLPDHQVVFDDEKGTKTVNTRVLFINGRRMPQGVIADFKPLGSLGERSLMVFLLAAFIATHKIEIRDIAVDEYVNGRLQFRYEWSTLDEKVFGPAIHSKVTRSGKESEVVGFRMVPITTDSFAR